MSALCINSWWLLLGVNLVCACCCCLLHLLVERNGIGLFRIHLSESVETATSRSSSPNFEENKKHSETVSVSQKKQTKNRSD